jgi:hypothetical protein
MIVVNDPGRAAGAGGAMGRGLGEGLGSGIAEMLQHKVGVMRQQQERSKLASALHNAGYSPQEASLLSMYPPEQQFKMMQMLGQDQQQPVTQTQQLAQQQNMKPLMQTMQPQQQTNPLEGFGFNNDQIEQQQQKNIQQQQLDRILAPQGQQKPPIKEPVKTKPGMKTAEYLPIPEVGGEVPAAAGLTKKTFKEKITAPLQTEKLRLEREKMAESAAMHGEVRKEKAFQFTKKYVEETESHADSARESEMRLDRLNTLNRQNKLMHPLMYSALKKVGMDVPGLQNADMQEFEKEKNAFLKNAKSIFGARVTNYEMNQFLKTIPSLEQTQEGRTRVIRNLKLAGKAAQIRATAMRDIIKENKRIPPLDLQQLVEERVGDQLDKISKQFASGERLPDFKSIKDADPSLYTGKTGTDFASGKKYQSDGKQWVEVR